VRLSFVGVGLPYFAFPTFFDSADLFEIGLSLPETKAAVWTISDILGICLTLAIVVPKANLADFVLPTAK
jgi:hypothetical protein